MNSRPGLEERKPFSQAILSEGEPAILTATGGLHLSTRGKKSCPQATMSVAPCFDTATGKRLPVSAHIKPKPKQTLIPVCVCCNAFAASHSTRAQSERCINCIVNPSGHMPWPAAPHSPGRKAPTVTGQHPPPCRTRAQASSSYHTHPAKSRRMHTPYSPDARTPPSASPHTQRPGRRGHLRWVTSAAS